MLFWTSRQASLQEGSETQKYIEQPGKWKIGNIFLQTLIAPDWDIWRSLWKVGNQIQLSPLLGLTASSSFPHVKLWEWCLMHLLHECVGGLIILSSALGTPIAKHCAQTLNVVISAVHLIQWRNTQLHVVFPCRRWQLGNSKSTSMGSEDLSRNLYQCAETSMQEVWSVFIVIFQHSSLSPLHLLSPDTFCIPKLQYSERLKTSERYIV